MTTICHTLGINGPVILTDPQGAEQVLQGKGIGPDPGGRDLRAGSGRAARLTLIERQLTATTAAARELTQS